MEKRLRDVVRLFFPLGRSRSALKAMTPYVSKRELSDVKYLVKLHKAGFFEESVGGGHCPRVAWPQLAAADEDVLPFVERINQKVRDAALLQAFQSFKKEALTTITGLVAPHLVGLDDARKAATLLLFAREPLYVLLLGDPDTGKSEILHALEKLTPHARYNIADESEISPSLLIDEGVALFDELHRLKKEAMVSLSGAMSAATQKKLAASLLAAAEPKGGVFLGKDVRFLRSQVPFDDAFLSRFHLVFLLRRPRELEEMTRKIVRSEKVVEGDHHFVREYVSFAEKLRVAFDDTYESMIVDFIENLKRDEQRFFVTVGPRTVVSVIRIAKAYARARLSRHVTADDVEAAMKLVKASLESGKTPSPPSNS